ncbi:hypothetical protein ACSSVZ_002708 [Amorphus sp. MBR-141]
MQSGIEPCYLRLTKMQPVLTDMIGAEIVLFAIGRAEIRCRARLEPGKRDRLGVAHFVSQHNVAVVACSPASGHCCELDFGSNIGAENAEEALFP